LSYRMIVSYDGTEYSGWQLQAQSKARTIQAEIERALTTVLREDRGTLCVCAAGRTDAGVHAVGQVRNMGHECNAGRWGTARQQGGGRAVTGCAVAVQCWSQQESLTSVNMLRYQYCNS
jgi:hypothetical protein